VLLFPFAAVRHLTAVKSDHSPILLSLQPEETNNFVCGRGKPFRYELMWETNDGIRSLIQQVWKSVQYCNSVKDMKDKLLNLGGELKAWGEKNFGAVRREMRELKKKLEKMRSEPARIDVSDEEQKIVDRLVLLNYQEEIMWKQRSRINWLQEGDNNNKFFHQRASRRKMRNTIVRLNRSDGSECTNVNEMQGMAVDFFRNLFGSEGTSNMHLVLDHVCRKRNWDICGEDLTRMVLKVLNGDEIPTDINVLFNGERLQAFNPTRGIRQGDPISPYLFLLCAEGLSSILKGEERIRGI